MRAPLLVLAISLSACAAPAARPIAPAAPPGFARVCVVRPSTLGADAILEVRDNGRLVGATRGSTYFCYVAAPGEHQISSDDDTGPTLLAARAGGQYFLHQEVSTLGAELHAHLDFVDEPTATEMIEDSDARVLVAVAGHEDRDDVLPVAPVRRSGTK